MNEQDSLMMYNKILEYVPYNEQEEFDRKVILDFLSSNDDAYLRSNCIAHMTASSWIVNKDYSKILMCYHNIYNSWSWCGGHADGNTNLLEVSIKEAKEETGLHNILPVCEDIFSLECLTVDGHEKNKKYVSSHLHLNVTYLLMADENEKLISRIGENSGVKWFTLSSALEASTEPWFVNRIYQKLNNKLLEKKNKFTFK